MDVCRGGLAMSRIRLSGSIFVAALLAVTICRASLADSTAELSIGGLLIARNTDISIESQELTITPDQVRVRYTFLNQSQNPVTAAILFPLPDLDLSEADN